MKMNKKKSILVVVCFLTIWMLTGCVMEETRNQILDVLEREQIIKEDWKLFETDIAEAVAVPVISYYDYIYVDDTFDIACTKQDKMGNYGEGFDAGVYMVRIYKANDNDVYEVEFFDKVDIQEYQAAVIDYGEGGSNIVGYETAYRVNEKEETNQFYLKKFSMLGTDKWGITTDATGTKVDEDTVTYEKAKLWFKTNEFFDSLEEKNGN